MIRLMIRLIIGLTLPLAAGVLLVRASTLTADTPPPPDRFTHPDCDNPCWLGIEPGITPERDAVAVLEQREIYHRLTRRSSIYFQTNSFSGDFWSREPGRGVVQAVNFRNQPCPLGIMLAYGRPDVIFGRGDGLVMYFAEGVAVGVYQRPMGSYAVNMSLVTPEDIAEYMDDAQVFNILRWRDADPHLRRVCEVG